MGDPIALVIAETRAQAVDAAELVDVDYDDLPVVADVEAAVADDAPLQFEGLGTNVATRRRDKDRSDPFEGADHVVRARMVNQRIATAPIEGNAILVEPDGRRPGHRLGLHAAPAHGPRPPRRRPGPDQRRRPGGRPSRGRGLRRQGRHRHRPRRDRPRGGPPRPSGQVDRDPQRGDALDAGPRAGAVRRARPDLRGPHRRPAAAGARRVRGVRRLRRARWPSARRT